MRPNCGNINVVDRIKRGFTLVELMITVALLVIMLYMIALIFTAAQSSFHDSRAAVEAHQTARAIFDMMRDELSAALLIRQGDGRMMLIEGVDQEEWADIGGAVQDWKGDALRFTTTAFQASRSDLDEQAPGAPRIVEVKYYLRGDELMKRVNWDDDFAGRTDWATDVADGDPAEAVGFNINNIYFRYLDRRAEVGPDVFRVRWTEDGNWPIDIDDRGRLPAAVEIVVKINMVDSAGVEFTEVLSEIIYLPNSELQG